MFGKYDITFCGNRSCGYERCIRHYKKIPVGVPVSMAAFQVINGKCEYRFDDNWETVDCNDQSNKH